MGDDWRVTLALDIHADAGQNAYGPKFVRELRSHFGDQVALTTPDARRVFLYVETAAGAEDAVRVSREVLARCNLSADIQLEHWDHSRGGWLNPWTGIPDSAAAEPEAIPDTQLSRKGLRKAGAIVGAVVAAVADTLPP
jgi:hypothetical protein